MLAQTKKPSVAIVRIQKTHKRVEGKNLTVSQIFNRLGGLTEKKYAVDGETIVRLFFQENKLKYQDFQPKFFTVPFLGKIREIIEQDFLEAKGYRALEVEDIF